MLDISLPFVLAAVSLGAFVIYPAYEKKVTSLYGREKITSKGSVAIVAMIAISVAVLAYAPSLAIKFFMTAILSILLYAFTYILTGRKRLSTLPAIAFLTLFFAFWNVWISNFFAAFIVVVLASALAALLTWRATLLFTSLLLLLDAFHVFVTEMMSTTAVKMIQLRLPTLIAVPTFPTQGWIFLGLGDLILASLLAIQTAKKFSRSYGIVAIAAMASGFLISENVIFNMGFQFFPATTMVAVGWLAVLMYLKLKGYSVVWD